MTRERTLPQILITCPITGEPAATGLTSDTESFGGEIFIEKYLSACPACGAGHTWNKEDAYLDSQATP